MFIKERKSCHLRIERKGVIVQQTPCQNSKIPKDVKMYQGEKYETANRKYAKKTSVSEKSPQKNGPEDFSRNAKVTWALRGR